MNEDSALEVQCKYEEDADVYLLKYLWRAPRLNDLLSQASQGKWFF